MAKCKRKQRLLGKSIRRIRMRRNMTQRELANAAGLRESALRSYELGERSPKQNTLERIAETLDVAPACFDTYGIERYDELVHALFLLAMVEWAEQYGKYTSDEITLEEYKDWKRKYQADEPEDESRSDDSFLKDKPVVCLECEERFASIGDAAAKLHLNARKLGNAIRENEPYHGLHFFLIAESWQDETK